MKSWKNSRSYLLERVKKIKFGWHREGQGQPFDFLYTKARSPIGSFYNHGSIMFNWYQFNDYNMRNYYRKYCHNKYMPFFLVCTSVMNTFCAQKADLKDITKPLSLRWSVQDKRKDIKRCAGFNGSLRRLTQINCLVKFSLVSVLNKMPWVLFRRSDGSRLCFL